ncbi:tRNA (mo5U34)-methyltransferase [Sphingomonas jejuensis]|uniref:tRNA (Mo5U34)-methyltransferase n=1 Tax=Sphingomonas jejuensis TaxID=904715 RepID=A0ABX0XMN9_9SPHN|nr:TIGR04290 family methyltransferase [Sphingomonas jejuensis]NJC34006.1 tRNA (mo5U34)-methyltransferase [Sphingomonas jejuensis]
MSNDMDLAERVRALGPWFHNLDLGGVMTAPDHFLYDYPNSKFRRFAHVLPEDLTGKSVLDIGCNAGFYSVEMKKRGADRVLGIDSDDHYLSQARFVADHRGFDIEYRNLSVYDLALLGERFDLVIFMGVLYHLRHPLLALDLIRSYVADDLMLYQSMQRGAKGAANVADDYDFFDADHFDAPDYPKMHFIEKRYSGDPTNWWAPNEAASAAMLRAAGFEIVAHPETEVFLAKAAPLPYGAGEPIHPASPPETATR